MVLDNPELKMYIPDHWLIGKKCLRLNLWQIIESKRFDYYEQVVNNALLKRMAVAGQQWANKLISFLRDGKSVDKPTINPV